MWEGDVFLAEALRMLTITGAPSAAVAAVAVGGRPAAAVALAVVAPTAAPGPIAASTAAEVGPPESTTVLGLPAL